MRTILIFTDWFTPAFKAGGPIQSVRSLSLQLSNSFKIYIYTSAYDHSSNDLLNVIEYNTWTPFSEHIKVFYQTQKHTSRNTLSDVLELVKPDYIYLNSIFSWDYTLNVLKLMRTGFGMKKIILAPRGMLKPSALNKKQFKKWIFLTWAKLIRLYDGITFHATNEEEKTEIINVFKDAKVIVIDNLPPALVDQVAEFSKERGSLRMICIGRIHPIKNILFLLQTLISIKSNLQLTILGSIEDENYKVKCDQIMLTLPLNIKVTFVSEKPHHEVRTFIEQHHIMILPTLGENYGHAIIETLATGRPVIISDQTPWKNLAQYNAGWDLSLADKQSWIDTIERAAGWDQITFISYCQGALNYAREHTNRVELVGKYRTMFSGYN